MGGVRPFRRLTAGVRPDRYPVVVGEGALAYLPELIGEVGLGERRPAIIADATVWRLHGPRLSSALGRPEDTRVLTVEPGEERKSREEWARLSDDLLAAGYGRDSYVLAFGGGVVGDLAGFVAATYMRGVPVVQLPTTLLAMVDASVGAKTGVNTPRGKNLVGAFHPPHLVLADTALLGTLPAAELRSGLAEAVKHGAIAAPGYLWRIERHAERLLAADPGAHLRLVESSVRIKARVVRRDPHEQGERAVLNFGHTIGHALEAASGYALRHGEAVAIGMVAAARLSERSGAAEEPLAEVLERVLIRLGLPVRIPAAIEPKEILARLVTDKKGRGGRPRFVLLRRLGDPLVAEGRHVHPLDPKLVLSVLWELSTQT